MRLCAQASTYGTIGCRRPGQEYGKVCVLLYYNKVSTDFRQLDEDEFTNYNNVYYEKNIFT